MLLTSRTLEKIVIIFFLLCAVYLVATCPCKVILSCHNHVQLFYFLIAVPLLIVFYLHFKMH